jgi:ABC-type transport system substrate-binding protein
MQRRVMIAVGIVIIVLISASAFWFLQQEPPTEVKQELIINRGSDGVTLDPAFMGLTPDYAVVCNIFNALTRYKQGTMELEPDLAESWDISSDGLTYTFHLRKGVKWHKDYGEFTAEDVKFSYERIMDPDIGSVHMAQFDSIEKIEVIDDYTVQITLKNKSALFLRQVSAFRQGFIVCKKALEELGEEFGRNPIGTGPFIFDSWVLQQELVLVANEEYFEGAPKLQKVTFKPIDDESVAFIALEAGEIDMMSVSRLETYNKTLENPDLKLSQGPGLGYMTLILNANKTRNFPFTDPKVRQALQYGINKSDIANRLLGGMVIPADVHLAPGYFGQTSDVQKYEYDPAKCKQLLSDAGFTDGFSAMLYFSSSPQTLELATLIQAQLKEAGVEVELNPLETSAYVRANRAGEPPMCILSISARPDPDIILTTLFHSEGYLNFAFYEGIDELLEQARVELDDEKRELIYNQICQKLAVDCPHIPLYYSRANIAMKKNVMGYTVHTFDQYGPLYNVYINTP